MAFTTKHKLEAAQRELAYRERNYPRWVGQGRMNQFTADRQIALMRAIAQDYEQQMEEEERRSRHPNLFD